jgi:3-dehydroquinate synthetase
VTELSVTQSAREPLRRFIEHRRITRFLVVCDANVSAFARSLMRGIPGRIAFLPFELGERRKRLSTVENVLEAFMGAGADRATTIVGFGGGVASDLFGFAASIFMRGVPYMHISTSLVAMVDAALGGKTGVDLESGKNLAGTFCDPIAMFAHVDALRTLPYRHLREGLAEVVKHGIIEGHELFDALETLAPHPFAKWPWETVVAGAQHVKRMIVSDDPLERGIRETLNLGHTFGHAIERASNYRVTHGAGVSIGLRAAGLLALRTGRFSREQHLRVLSLLILLRMPLWTRESPARIFAAMFADKKKREGRLRFVLPRAIGDVEYGVIVPERQVRAVLEGIGRPPGDEEFR